MTNMSKEELEVAVLCIQSLNNKWHAGSAYGVDILCPFCYHADMLKLTHKELKKNEIKSSSRCNYCICPKEICSDSNRDGIISDLYECIVKDIPIEKLNEIRKLFLKYIPPEFLHMVDGE